jgi:acetyl-CoA carboxylase biotin carboxyl carrier protein
MTDAFDPGGELPPEPVPVEPVTVEPAPLDPTPVEPAPHDPAIAETDLSAVWPRVTDEGDASLLRLIDRLSGLLERSELTELEVEAGETALILRKPAAIAVAVASSVGAGAPDAAESGAVSPAQTEIDASRPTVRAPLTGIYYASPSPGSPPYVQVGGEVAIGQIVGLIEAMKLFNEIKSDIAGRVVRVVAENGQLVKAKQPLIEVEPL